MSAEIVDSTAVDITPDPPAVASLAVARQRRSEVIRPLSTDALVESFAEYQNLLPRLLNSSDYQDAGGGEKFVKKSGWRKIATAFDLDVVIVTEEVERDEDGHILRAKTTARATTPAGRSMDGDGYCTIDEFTGKRAKNPKLENDLRGTAATRAKNRAISDLVGMGEVSAEEVSAGGAGHTTAVPSWAAPATETPKRNMLTALEALMGHDLAVEYAQGLAAGMGGQVPDVVAQWVGAMPSFIAAAQQRAAGTDQAASS